MTKDLSSLLSFEFNGCRPFGHADTLDGAQHFIGEASALAEAVRYGCMAEDGFDTANVDIQAAALGGITRLLALASFSLDLARKSA